MSHGYVNEVLKVAAGEQPGWAKRQLAGQRAVRMGDKGIKKIINHPDLIKKNLTASLKGLGAGAAIGGGVGAGLGALLGKGQRGKAALIGALLGSLPGSSIGSGIGEYRATKEWLKERGLDQGLLGIKKLSPEAKKKYLDAYK